MKIIGVFVCCFCDENNDLKNSYYKFKNFFRLLNKRLFVVFMYLFKLFVNEEYLIVVMLLGSLSV